MELWFAGLLIPVRVTQGQERRRCKGRKVKEEKGQWLSGYIAGPGFVSTGTYPSEHGGETAAWRWKCGSANQKSSSAVSVEKFQTLLAGMQRYPAISEDASRLLFGFFFLSLLFSPQKNKPNHRAGIMMVLFNISGYEYQIRLQTPEKSGCFLLSQ